MNHMRENAHRLWIAATAAVLTLSLAACMVGPDFEAPKAPSTKGYTEAGTPEASAGEATEAPQHVALGKKVSADWWTLLHSPELDKVIQRAIADNHTLAAAKQSLLQAREAVTVAGGPLYPQVDFTGQFGRQKYGAAFLGPQGSSFPAFTAYSIGPSVSYDLDLFGGTRRNIEQQQALAEFQGYQLDAAYLSLTGNVVTQALQIASLRAQIKTVEDILVDDQKNLDLVRAARETGAVTQVDVLSAESQLANDRTLLPPLRQQLSVARHALSILVGKAPADWTPPDFDLSQLALPDELPVSLPSELVHERPDILAAESQLHAASAAIGVATANMYPQITLTASLTQQALDPGHLFNGASTAWSLLAGATQPIFHGGELEAAKRASVDAFKASFENYQQTVLQSFGQVADVLQALDHDREELAAQKHALESASSSLQLTRLSYSAGNVGVLQVLDAERLYQQAQLGYVRAEAQRYLDTTQLFLAMGGGLVNRSPAAVTAALGQPEH